MQYRSSFEMRAFAKDKLPPMYFASADKLKNKFLRTAIPATQKNTNGHYKSGRIVAVRAE